MSGYAIVIWSNEGNRLKVEMVKAELFVHFNYSMKCAEFAQFLKSDRGKELVKAAKSEQKYNFKI